MSIDTIRYYVGRVVTSPYVVTGAGVAVLGISCLPITSILYMTNNVSIRTLQYYNLSSFVINVIAVSIPGRLDGEDATTMTTTGTIPIDCNSSTAGTTSTTTTTMEVSSDYNPNTSKTLIVPSGWAFIIWAPIYIGELIFCTYGQFVLFNNTNSMTKNAYNKEIFSILTKSFVVACVYQSLWCASFRSTYFRKDNKWKRFISVFMLGSTAYSLYALNTISSSNTNDDTNSLFYNLSLLPLYLHSGWTTAATLVNLNGSIASLYNNSTNDNNNNNSDTVIIAVGHTSVVLASIIGCYTSIIQKSTIFSITIAWALTACSTGIYAKKCTILQSQKYQQSLIDTNNNNNNKKKNDDAIIINDNSDNNNYYYYSQRLLRAMTIQQYLCQVGAIVCITSATVMNYFTF